MRTFIILLLLSACDNAPIPNTPHPGYPCGYQGVVCGGGMCCDEGQVCGAEHTGCPAGECCYVGDSHEYGARKPTRQRPER